MQKREAKFTTKFNRWVQYRWDGPSFIFEAKVSKGNTVLFSAVSSKQVRNLRLAKHKIFVHKFSDFERMGTPVDGVAVKGAAYVVIQFDTDNPQNKDFYMIDIDTWQLLETAANRKSITPELAKTHGLHCQLG